MPTYQYECANCDHQFEILQSINENRLKKCPECGKPKLNRLIGKGSGIIFKGSGFYETDYKRKTPAGNESSSSSSKPAPKASPSPASASAPSVPSGGHGCSPHRCGCAAGS